MANSLLMFCRASLIALLFLSAFIQQVEACRCEGEESTLDAVKRSDIVFDGKVISRIVTSDLRANGIRIVGDTTKYLYQAMKYPVAIIKLTVSKVYKGRSSDTITIITPTNGAGCGVSFKTGGRYIVYATKRDEVSFSNSISRLSTNDKTYWTHLCTRTDEWYKTEEDALKALKK